MDKTLLTLVRHGETEWNLQGRLQGHLDSPLTGRGRAQAAALAEALAGRAFDAIYSSDLGRAMQTAEILAGPEAEVVTIPDLRERHLGCFQGHTWDELDQTMPETVRAFRQADADWPIPAGESAQQRFERNIRAFEKIAQDNPGRQVLVIGHGGSMDSMMRHVLGLDLITPRPFTIRNAARNVFIRTGGRWMLDVWGDACHLAQTGSLDDI
ncbi:MAG: histidine phosphatase family protein [Phycisphaerae bacterium]